MSDAPAPVPESAGRQATPGARKLLFTGIIIDLVLAVLTLLVAVLAQANSPTGQGGGAEIFIALIVFCGAPGLAWSLYSTGTADIRWLNLLAWAPIILLAIGIPIAIAYA